MKNKETLDFLKGTAMDGIINNVTAATANTNPVEKVEVEAIAEAAPGPSVIPPVKETEVKKSSAKKAAVKSTEITSENKIFTNVRIKKVLIQQAKLILGDGKKTQEILEHIFLEFIKKNKKVLAQNIEKEIENLKSKI